MGLRILPGQRTLRKGSGLSAALQRSSSDIGVLSGCDDVLVTFVPRSVLSANPVNIDFASNRYNRQDSSSRNPIGHGPYKREHCSHEQDMSRARAALERRGFGIVGAVRLSDVDGRHDLAVSSLLAASSAVFPTVAAFPTSARIGFAGSGGCVPRAGRSAGCAITSGRSARCATRWCAWRPTRRCSRCTASRISAAAVGRSDMQQVIAFIVSGQTINAIACDSCANETIFSAIH